MVGVYRRLLTYWQNGNVGFNPGLVREPCQLSDIETDISTYPLYLLSLLSVANGMDDNTEYDAEGFRFYSLKEVYRLSGSSLFVFADYLHESWLYGVNDNGVFVIFNGIDNAELVASSMEAFLEHYLVNSDDIYPSI